jgi:hypothetical protein
LRRLAGRGPGDPAVGPLLVVGGWRRLAERHSQYYPRTIEHVLQGTRFHLLDTSSWRGRTIDLDAAAGRAFGPGSDPVVFFLAGRWPGRDGNRFVNHDRLRKILDIQDQKVQTQLQRILLPNRFDAFLYRYQGAEMDRLRAATAPLGVRSYYWPHYLDFREHRDWGLPKAWDLCLYGTVHPGTYPLRHRLRALLEAQTRFRVRIVRREEGLEGQALSRVINQSRLTVADTVGVHDRFITKYLEIPFSGSCILGNVPTRHRDLFGGRVVEVDAAMSDDEILATIERALADPARLARMAAELRDALAARYLRDRGRADFWAHLRDFARNVPARR